jgi:hypothetical protein
MNFNFYHRFDEIPTDDWEILPKKNMLFLSKSFLQTFEYDADIHFSPVYVVAKIDSIVVGILYAQIFKLNSQKIKEYIRHGNSVLTSFNRVKLIFAEFLSLRVCFMGNLFMSNECSFYFKEQLKPQEFSKLLQEICVFSGSKFVMIPEFFNDIIPEKNLNFSPIYVEPDMHMKILNKWTHFDDYTNDIQSKYKKKLRKVLSNSSSLKIIDLKIEDLKLYESQISSLFNNVFYNSSFNATKFKPYFFDHFMQNGINISVQGYFFDDKLVGFSSSIVHQNMLYVYFMGLDYNLHKSFDIYSKMLYDKIKYAIDHRLDLIKFGRTASEFKSNFGAIPQCNKAYVYSNSYLLARLLNPFINMIKPKIWNQRNPFK